MSNVHQAMPPASRSPFDTAARQRPVRLPAPAATVSQRVPSSKAHQDPQFRSMFVKSSMKSVINEHVFDEHALSLAESIDGAPTPRQETPWHTYPLSHFRGPFHDTPTAGSSSLSIVSSPIFGSIGKREKIPTMKYFDTGRGLRTLAERRRDMSQLAHWPRIMD
jgi:hypothetical protein